MYTQTALNYTANIYLYIKSVHNTVQNLYLENCVCVQTVTDCNLSNLTNRKFKIDVEKK